MKQSSVQHSKEHLPTKTVEMQEEPMMHRSPEADCDAEWDHDLESEDTTTKTPAELYLDACRHTGTFPVSSFFSHRSKSELNLNHYGVRPPGAKALAIALQSDSDIISLELSNNVLQAEGASHLMKMLRTNTTLRSLNLSHNRLHLKGAQIISEMLRDNSRIESIKLAGNDFNDGATKYITQALEGDYVVKELDLSSNKICKGEHLGCMLAKNVGLEVLNLSWNHIPLCGAWGFSDGIKANSTLKELQLAWNGFSQREAKSLGEALKRNSTLVLLDLSGNHIDDKAAALLCQGLATNEALRVLKLSHNPMTNTGALTLLGTVKKSTTSALQEIDISTVFVWETFLELLEEARQLRPALLVQYSVMRSVIRNVSAFHSFQRSLRERNETILDFFQALDKGQNMTISTSSFRKAVKAANIPLDQRQLEWLIRTLDRKCTATINYRHFVQGNAGFQNRNK